MSDRSHADRRCSPRELFHPIRASAPLGEAYRDHIVDDARVAGGRHWRAVMSRVRSLKTQFFGND
jgi:hypothetical protein